MAPRKGDVSGQSDAFVTQGAREGEESGQSKAPSKARLIKARRIGNSRRLIKPRQVA